MSNLKHYTINMVSLGYFLRHKEALLIKADTIVTNFNKEVDSQSYRSNSDDFSGNNKIHVPILNLDGILVLLEESIQKDHMGIINDTWSIPSVYKDFDFESVTAISFRDTEDLNLLDCLSLEGLFQLEKFHAAREDYNSACIIRDIRLDEIEEMKGKV